MNEIAKRAENGVSLDGMLSQADLYVKSGFFPKHIDSKEKAVVIMMKGRELGLPFTEALSKICVINGIATTKVETLLALARKTGQLEDFKQKFFPNEINPAYCEVTIKRKGNSSHVCRFGDEEAQTMGLTGKDNYKKQKATMYSWRAISKNLRVTFPDAIGGLYLEEEIADDVIIHPSEDHLHAEVTEVITRIPQASEQPQPCKPSGENVSGADIPEDQLANYIMPIGKYKGRRMAEVWADETPTGNRKGAQYIKWGAENFTNAELKDVCERFIKIMSDIPEVQV